MLKSTALRHYQGVDVASSARQFKDQVQQGLASMLAAALRQGEDLPDLTFFQELIGRLLEDSGTGLVEVDRRYTKDVVSVTALRVERNQLTAKMRLRLRDVRYLLDRSVGGPTAKAALRDRRLSNVKPAVLVQAARDLATTLRDPNLALAEAGSNTAVFTSAEAIAAMLETEAAELEQVLARLSPQQRAKQDNLQSKIAEVEAATEKNRRCSDALFGLYRLAGLDFHAERLRPKGRRKRMEEPEKAPPPAPASTALMRVN